MGDMNTKVGLHTTTTHLIFVLKFNQNGGEHFSTFFQIFNPLFLPEKMTPQKENSKQNVI